MPSGSGVALSRSTDSSRALAAPLPLLDAGFSAAWMAR